MYLSKLEIFGFKSFADKVEIRFTDGLTAIVGPNGCGKTNVVDAIRWALGEQRSSALRSEKMESVIFNGTRNRKAIGMAEVSLTVHNNKGILPIEYSDVTITRRLFRSGESEYLLNKNLCRLKDITNLFMDTGMSSNAYSVIELKMIESILSNKADDRRVLFEEAAGVNKYKHRRKAALRKLEAVQHDLTRVNDIYAEVQKKVNSLDRQSKKAEQFNRLYAESRQLEIDLAERELFKYNQTIKLTQISLESLREEKSILSDLVEKLEIEQHQLYDQLDLIERKLSAKREEILFQTEAIHKLQEQIITHREKSSNLEKNIIGYQNEIQENQKRINELQNSISNSEDEVKIFESRLIETENQLNQLTVRKSEIDVFLQIKQSEVTEKQNELKKLTDSFNELSNNYEKLSIRTQNNQESIEALIRKISEQEKIIQKSSVFMDDLMRELFAIQKKIKDAEDELTFNQQRKEDLEKNIDELKKEELEINGAIYSVRQKIDFIQNLIENLEGISKGTKELISQSDWNKGSKILAADAGAVEEQYKYAVDAPLKNYLSHILLEDKSDLFEGIKILKEKNFGQASFFTFDDRRPDLFGYINNFVQKRNRKKVEKELGFRCWVVDLIECLSQWKKFFEITVGNICLVDSIETAQKLTSKYKDIDCVTIGGDIFRSSGIVEAGSEKASRDTALGRKRVLNELNDILTKESYRLEQITNKLADSINEANAIDIKGYTESLKLLRNDESNLEKQISQIQFEKNKAVEEIEKLHIEITNIKKINEDLELKKEKLNQEITTVRNLIEIKEEEFNDESNKLSELENKFDSINAEENEKKILFTKYQSEKTNKLNLISHSQNEITSLSSTNQRRLLEIEKSRSEIEQSKKLLEEISINKKDLEEKKKKLNEELRLITQDYNAIRGQISVHEKELHERRKVLETLSEDVHSKDMTINECKLKSQGLVDRIQEEYQVKIQEKEFENIEDFNFEEVSKRVHILKNKMRALGPVNSLAFQEYEEEKERLKFLTEQRNDLLESEKELHQIIEEINVTAQKLFVDTFDRIRVSFINIFRTLFDEGDEADLKLEEGVDPLEAKIEIIAKPKGKRPTSIDLLSGGEKTLTATALLFAIYLVKPSPFCILDEVDAPLDDANIGRFIRLIKKFSDNTQFIIVTHNKLTMEAAETLYGVTMEEEGVSKLVSVRFSEELKVA